MTTTNSITGDPIQTKPASDNYRQNFDRIFKSTVSKQAIADVLGLPNDLRDGETMTEWALRKRPSDICPRCGKVSAADIHTCTPLGDGLCDKCDPDTCCRL